MVPTCLQVPVDNLAQQVLQLLPSIRWVGSSPRTADGTRFQARQHSPYSFSKAQDDVFMVQAVCSMARSGLAGRLKRAPLLNGL